MDDNTAREIVRMCNGWCRVGYSIHKDDISRKKYTFFHITKIMANIARRHFKLGKLTKQYYDGDLALIGEDFEFWITNVCQITGYKEEIIPEHIQKTPIYNCQEK